MHGMEDISVVYLDALFTGLSPGRLFRKCKKNTASGRKLSIDFGLVIAQGSN